jgi:hypothetical protein
MTVGVSLKLLLFMLSTLMLVAELVLAFAIDELELAELDSTPDSVPDGFWLLAVGG